MNEYLKSVLTKETPYFVCTLLRYQIIDINYLKEQVISSSDGNIIYSALIAIKEFKNNEDSPILTELEDALLNTNNYKNMLKYLNLYMYTGPKSIKIVSKFIPKILESTCANDLIYLLSYVYSYDEFNAKYEILTNIIKRIIEIKGYSQLLDFLNDKGTSKELIKLAINNANKEFLTLLQKFISNQKIKGTYNNDFINELNDLRNSRLKELKLIDNSLSPRQKYEYLQELITYRNFNKIDKYHEYFASLFQDQEPQITK